LLLKPCQLLAACHPGRRSRLLLQQAANESSPRNGAAAATSDSNVAAAAANDSNVAAAASSIGGARSAAEPLPSGQPMPKAQASGQGALRTLPNPFQRAYRMPQPVGNTRPPTAWSPRLQKLNAGCLDHSNVRRWGARGDGRASDNAALLRADRAKSSAVLYLPVGVYRLTKSLTLNKPVMMGAQLLPHTPCLIAQPASHQSGRLAAV
jgi:hypothetical protein